MSCLLSDMFVSTNKFIIFNTINQPYYIESEGTEDALELSLKPSLEKIKKIDYTNTII